MPSFPFLFPLVISLLIFLLFVAVGAKVLSKGAGFREVKSYLMLVALEFGVF